MQGTCWTAMHWTAAPTLSCGWGANGNAGNGWQPTPGQRSLPTTASTATTTPPSPTPAACWPTSPAESAHRHLMLLLASADGAARLMAQRDLPPPAAEELGVEPSDETNALLLPSEETTRCGWQRVGPVVLPSRRLQERLRPARPRPGRTQPTTCRASSPCSSAGSGNWQPLRLAWRNRRPA